MRESIRRDRARIQIGKISNFGLLEMTRQRLREGSIKWETQLSLESFAQKICKKIQYLAFTEKVKILKTYVPEKVKLFIENNLIEELKLFQKKYSLKIEILSDDRFIIPEYKIDLLNKSKKFINKVENFNGIKLKVLERKVKIREIKQTKKVKTPSKKTKIKKNL